jgi:DNA (cytosine-5)-methyltransferase 1
MNQTTIFDVLYPKYKITKPIRLIELFAGYGSQALALKYLGVKFEHWKICEWAVKSIQAYKDAHFTDDTRNYSEVASKEEIQEMLFKWGISSNYNEPMTREQINRLSEEQLRTIFNNISATNNLVNIQDVKGDDLAIVNKDEYDYILTYSFPCQDLSLAGKGKGMADTSTRSGMLWEVERILNELKTTNSLPQILLMENVPQVHGSDNVEHFNKWQLALENMGYKNYFQDLIATDYGIPQTRNRCFMVSILGDYSYSFPKPIPLKLKLKDLLEDEVDEKYYLSDKQIKCLSSDKMYKNGYIRGNQFKKNINPDVCTTITASSSDRASDTFISIKNATKKGYLEATDGDGINLSNRMEHQRGNVQKDKIQTLTTSGGNDRGVCLKNLKIRKLTPRECGRLMGIKDKDIDKILKSQSNSSAFHLFGDSICTSCLMALFSQLLDISWEDKLWNIKNSTKTENI